MSSAHVEDVVLGPPVVHEVADGVFAYVQPDGSWWINNCGFVAGGHAVVAIDTCSTERRTRAYLRAVEAHAGRSPDTLVCTHHHGDHTNGNGLVPQATIVGHHRCREEMLRTGIQHYDGVFDPVEWGALELAPPTVTFEDRLDVHVDDRVIELHHLTDAAHTTNDVVAFLPANGVLFTGDLVFNGGTPFAVMGSVAGSLAALDAIERLGATVVVPGHGEPGGPELVATPRAYLRWLLDVAGDAVAAGVTPLEAARDAARGPFAELGEPERLAGNLHRAMAEVRGLQPGAPIDLAAAFADMLALNGGRPLRCRA